TVIYIGFTNTVTSSNTNSVPIVAFSGYGRYRRTGIFINSINGYATGIPGIGRSLGNPGTIQHRFGLTKDLASKFTVDQHSEVKPFITDIIVPPKGPIGI